MEDSEDRIYTEIFLIQKIGFEDGSLSKIENKIRNVLKNALQIRIMYATFGSNYMCNLKYISSVKRHYFEKVLVVENKFQLVPDIFYNISPNKKWYQKTR